jgi:hypothetical protein
MAPVFTEMIQLEGHLCGIHDLSIVFQKITDLLPLTLILLKKYTTADENTQQLCS